eukprot:GEMP01099736.1.p1 GENE.GEMP01099736.1~~GEMP01099736.1.p1  ORF type:complete len:140 (+),score=17.03 GEMP01099736.1:106-525(+)
MDSPSVRTRRRVLLITSWPWRMVAHCVGRTCWIKSCLPCNQFGGQEPYPEEEIESHLNSKGLMLTFPLMKKGAVLGATGLPLFQWLQEVCGGGAISWNFEKFLISRSGKPSRRFLPSDDLNDVESHLRQLIHDKGRSDL